MDFQLHNTGKNHSIKSVSSAGIQIGDNLFKSSILLTADTIEPLETINSLADISNQLLEGIIVKHPAVILIGTGKQPQRASEKQSLDWQNAGIGIEVMDTPAACRTFNLLMSEDREVAAILMVPG